MSVVAGLIVIAASAVAALVFVSVGLVRLVAEVRGLKRRVESYLQLPIVATFEATSARLNARDRGAEFESLASRVAAAFAELNDARRRLTTW